MLSLGIPQREIHRRPEITVVRVMSLVARVGRLRLTILKRNMSLLREVGRLLSETWEGVGV
jgi:hypothetical protein